MRAMVKGFLPFYLFTFLPLSSSAQVGKYRNDFAVGINGGYIMSDVGFEPQVTQSMASGFTGGISLRYVSEKYFTTICSIMAEINYAQIGWKEDIEDKDGNAVINSITGVGEKYSRKINYIQVPIFAHLAWGKEEKGLNFFVQAGPQFGFYLSESTDKNFDIEQINITDRANSTVEQYKMDVENKFDYGIAAGGGIEFSNPYVGHLLLEGRYYYGLGNIYGNSKHDYFGKSNFGNIVIKLTYLFDIVKTKNRLK